MKPKHSRPPLSLIDLGPADKSAPTPADEALFSPAPEIQPEPVAAEARAPEPAPEAAFEPATVTVPRPRERDGFARHAVLIAVAAGVVWTGSLLAFVLGFQSRFGAFDYQPFQVTVIAALALLPFAFMILAAQAIRQGARLAAATRAAREMAQDVAIPAALAADQVGGAMEAMREEIARAAAAAEAAQAPLAALRASLADETVKLQAAASAALEAGRGLADNLARERGAVDESGAAMRRQAEETAEALTAQARLVAEASDLAQMQLAEAQAGLAARAADLALAGGSVESAAGRAADMVARQSERLERAGEAVTGNLSRLGADLAREREQIFALAGGLRDDQTAFAEAAEVRAAGLVAAVTEARQGAAVLNTAADEAQASLRALIASAADEVKRLAETAQSEQAAFDAGARAVLEAFGADAANYREAIEAQHRTALQDLATAAEEARAAAALPIEEMAERMELRAKAVRAELDQLGEAAFAAGQRADQAYDARMAAARALIEQSAELVDEAGLRAAERIGTGLAGARGAVDDLAALVEEIERRIDALPDSAREKAETVRAAVERGAADLAEAARRTAQETQAIDAAFQERVRRNYEVLSEAVRLMGRVAAAAEPPPTAAAPAPVPPAPRPAPPEAYVAPAVAPVVEEVAAPIAVGERRSVLAAAREPTAAFADPGLRPAALSPTGGARPSVFDSAASLGLRPRLRLTPAPAEPPPAPRSPEPAAEREEEWTWKELLSSIEEHPQPSPEQAERLVAEIDALGVDAETVLPSARTDEIAAVVHAGDLNGAREVVVALAGTAVRRLSGRLLADEALRAEAEDYVKRYQSLLRETGRRDREGFTTAALLGSDEGRAFLLLDAASSALQ